MAWSWMRKALPSRTTFLVHLPEGVPSEIGVWTYALEDQRKRTLRFAEGLRAEALEWTPDGAPNSIGCLLYHLLEHEAHHAGEIRTLRHLVSA